MATKKYSVSVERLAWTARWLLPGINRQVVLFITYSALFHIGMFGIADVILNFYFVSLGYDPDAIGLLQSVPRVGGMLTGIPVGMLANRIGARKIIIYATTGLTVAFVLMLVIPSLPVLVLSRFLMGLFYGAVQIATAPLMMTLVAKQYQTYQFSYHNVVSMGATSFGSLIGGFLPLMIVSVISVPEVIEGIPNAQTPFAYGMALFIAALITLLSVLPLLRMTNPTVYIRAVDAGIRPPAIKIPWRKLLLLSLPYLFFGFTGGLTFPFYNLFFRTTFNLPDESVGAVLTIGWLGMGIIPLMNPWWERRFGRVTTLVITMNIAALAFFILSLSGALALSVIAFIIAVSFRNIMGTLFQPLVLDVLSPELHNSVSSINFLIWNIGWLVATLVSGFLQKNYGFDFVMLLVSVGVCITAFSIQLIFKRTQSAAATSPTPTA